MSMIEKAVFLPKRDTSNSEVRLIHSSDNSHAGNSGDYFSRRQSDRRADSLAQDNQKRFTGSQGNTHTPRHSTDIFAISESGNPRNAIALGNSKDIFAVPEAGGYDNAVAVRPSNDITYFNERDEGSDMWEYASIMLAIFLKRKWSIVFLTLLVFSLAVIASISIKPVYRSTATLIIETENNNLVGIKDIFNDPGYRAYLATQYEILRSRGIVEQVKQRLSLDSKPEFKLPEPSEAPAWSSLLPAAWVPMLRAWLPAEWLPPDTTSQSAQNNSNLANQDFVSTYLDRLVINPVNNSQLVEVGFEAHDAELAAAIANEHSQLYIENDIQSRSRTRQDAAEALNERLAGVRANLKAAELDLQNFREHEQLLDIEGVRTLTVQRLNALSTQLMDSDRRRVEAEVLYNTMQKATDRSLKNPRPALPTALQSDEILRQLLAEETSIVNNISELESIYKPTYPDIAFAKTKLAGVRSGIDQRLQVFRDQLQQDYHMAISNQASVKNALDLAKNEILEINRKEFQLHELERKVETNQKLVDTISERVAEIGATQGLQPTKVSIMDRAIVPAAPFKPNRNMIMLFGLVGGLLLGIFWCLVREFFDKTIKKVDDVEDRLNLPMLGFLPRIKTGKIFRNKAKRPELYFISKPQSKFAEAMRNIRTNVVLSSVDDSRKIIMVTSSRSGEGKSVLSLNLASAFAENSKVLLIDADMRDPSLGEYFGLDKSANGLSHYTAGLCSLSECIYKFDDSKISFIPAGIIPPNPLTLLSSQRFANLLNVLKEEYSNIIIDSPPVLAVGDSAMLSRLVSGVIMVVRSESTPHKLAQEAIRRLRACRGAPLLGVVLNDLHIKRYSSYDASYGYGLTTE